MQPGPSPASLPGKLAAPAPGKRSDQRQLAGAAAPPCKRSDSAPAVSELEHIQHKVVLRGEYASVAFVRGLELLAWAGVLLGLAGTIAELVLKYQQVP